MPSRTFVVEDEAAAADLLAGKGWTDGLPIVAPTRERVAAILDWAGMAPDQLMGVEPVKSRTLSAEKVAINAVMAGCQPPHFPVVAAAVQAMCHPDYLLHGSSSSTGGCAVLVVVNGPIRRQLGMTGTFSCLGGGDPAALVIGRAVRLVVRNLVEVRPGDLDRSTLGHPGKVSFCLAEDEEGSPWRPLAQDRGIPADGTSAVTVMAASGPRQVLNEWTTQPDELLATFAAEMRANLLHYSIWGGNYVVVIPKQLRDILHAAGVTKADVRQYLYEHAQVRRRDWASVGKRQVVGQAKADKVYRALPSPEHCLVVAAGGPAGGFAAVIPPWLGHRSSAVTVPIGACVEC
ncbi:MAG: hypothetical protein GEV08_18690 [Acidimicrobiia bacterium]|nr:hypothetical protein [Acidimicrobiia bacterium]